MPTRQRRSGTASSLAPGAPVGDVTPGTGAFTTLSSSGATSLATTSGQRVGIGSGTALSQLHIFTPDGEVKFGENAFPGKAAATDVGMEFSKAGQITSGVFTEVNGAVLSIAANTTQTGNYDTAISGAIFRLDTRVAAPYVVIIRRPPGSAEIFDFLHSITSGATRIGGNSSSNTFVAQLEVRSNSAGTVVQALRPAASQTADIQQWLNSSGTAISVINQAGNAGIRNTAPTSYLHLGAGSSSANNAPLKYTSGSLLTTPEVGAEEFLTNDRYYTGTDGVRRRYAVNGDVIRLKGFTVSTLPAGVQGDKAFVTDALTPTYLTAVVGGGSVVTEVFYDGTTWVST